MLTLRGIFKKENRAFQTILPNVSAFKRSDNWIYLYTEEPTQKFINTYEDLKLESRLI